MKPSIGRIVIFKLTAEQARDITDRRAEGKRVDFRMIHCGNPVSAGDEFPATIVRTWGANEGAAVNLQVQLDGNDTLWVTSALEGTDNGNWHVPPRVDQTPAPTPTPAPVAETTGE